MQFQGLEQLGDGLGGWPPKAYDFVVKTYIILFFIVAHFVDFSIYPDAFFRRLSNDRLGLYP